ALHEVGHRIVGDAVRSQHKNRSLPKISDLDRTLCSPNFTADVVAEDGIAAQLHHTQRAALEYQINDRIINIAHGFHFRVSQRSADRMYLLHLPHIHAREIKVVDPHTSDQA